MASLHARFLLGTVMAADLVRHWGKSGEGGKLKAITSEPGSSAM